MNRRQVRTSLMLGQRHRHRHRQGFTLVELLIVLAIVTVMIAVLLPTLASSRDSSRRLVCTANTRSITIGMIAHAADHSQGRFTDRDRRGDDSLAYLYRANYLTQTPIALCPQTINRLGEPGDEHHGLPIGLSRAARNAHDTDPGHSYETFHHLNPGQFPGFAIDEVRLLRSHDIIPPDRSFIVLDNDSDPHAGGMVDGRYGYNNIPDAQTNNHGSAGMNIAFLDGSARFVPADQWIQTLMFSGHLDGASLDMVRAKQLLEPRLQWGLRTDGGDGLRYWLE